VSVPLVVPPPPAAISPEGHMIRSEKRRPAPLLIASIVVTAASPLVLEGDSLLQAPESPEPPYGTWMSVGI
jgi:hypothetical protein